MSFWKLLGNNTAASGLATAADALKAGADWRTVGLAAAVGGLGGLLQSLVTHQAAQHPVVQAAAASHLSTLTA